MTAAATRSCARLCASKMDFSGLSRDRRDVTLERLRPGRVTLRCLFVCARGSVTLLRRCTACGLKNAARGSVTLLRRCTACGLKSAARGSATLLRRCTACGLKNVLRAERHWRRRRRARVYPWMSWAAGAPAAARASPCVPRDRQTGRLSRRSLSVTIWSYPLTRQRSSQVREPRLRARHRGARAR